MQSTFRTSAGLQHLSLMLSQDCQILAEGKKMDANPSPKSAKIFWTAEMKEAFEQLKSSLINEVILQIPLPGKPYRIWCDASNYAVGGTLEQEVEDGTWRPVAFFSRKLAGKGEYGQRMWHPREK